jgi:nucleoid DNA-binding protein
MNKAELVAAVSESSGLSTSQVRVALDSILDTVTSALADGQEVRLVGFGSFAAARFPHRPVPGRGGAEARPQLSAVPHPDGLHFPPQ